MKVMAWTRKSRGTHTHTNAQTTSRHFGDYVKLTRNWYCEG